MEWLIQSAIAAALVPPGVLVLTLLAGFLLLRRRRWVGRAVIAFTVAALYVLSTQYAADRLLLALEPAPADPRASPAGEVIVVLGNTAMKNLLDTREGITRLRGIFQDYKGIKVMPTFHPAYLLRDPSKKRETWEDLKKVRAYLDSYRSTDR